MLTVIYLWCLQAISGLIADARRVVNQARDEASNYRFTYSQPIPVKVGAPTDNVISCVKTQSPPPFFCRSIWWIEFQASCTFSHSMVPYDLLAAASCLVHMEQKGHSCILPILLESRGWVCFHCQYLNTCHHMSTDKYSRPLPSMHRLSLL